MLFFYYFYLIKQIRILINFYSQFIMNHYLSMFIIMFLSGLLSTMNIWVDKFDDVRFSINDIYMILLMIGWMFFFMWFQNNDNNIKIFGFILIAINIYCIRNQIFISEKQYKIGMIPHHSMAIHMSKKLLERKNHMKDFLENLIVNQEKEILFMKRNNLNHNKKWIINI